MSQVYGINPSGGADRITVTAVTLRTVTANYTVTANDYVINANGTLTITLPTTGLSLGQVFRVKNIGTGTVTVTSSALIDNATSSVISIQYNSFDYHWDGTQYGRFAALQMSNTRMGQAALNFGPCTGSEGDTAVATIAATWITSNSIVLAAVAALPTADHDAEDAVIEGIQAKVINVLPGVSFDIEAYAPVGSWGQYIAVYQGLLSRTQTT